MNEASPATVGSQHMMIVYENVRRRGEIYAVCSACAVRHLVLRNKKNFLTQS